MHPIVLKSDLTKEAQAQLSQASELAIDCEMMGLNPFRDRLCVVQIGLSNGHCYLVQIREEEDPVRLRSIFENPDIVKIFHYARLDNLFLWLRTRIDVQNIYCTKIASRLCRTYTDKHGLKELVKELLGERMEKQAQSSDWGKETLSAEQVHYAAYDVKYLFKIKNILEEMLHREGRHELSRKLFDFLPVQRKLDELQMEMIFEH